MSGRLARIKRAGLLAGWLLAQVLSGMVAQAAPPLPDFVIESVVVGPEPIAQGLPLPVSAVVKNRGAAAGDARHVDVWHHWTNAVPPVFGDVGDTWARVGRLEAGESRTVVLPPQVLEHAGTNRLCARVEFENLVSESINTNNHFCFEYAAAPMESQLAPVHRFWSDRFRGHFFTISEEEKAAIIANNARDWRYEGVAYCAYSKQVAGTRPLFRFWSDRYHGHFFTISEQERDNIIANLARDWRYEGVAYYVIPSPVSGSVPVFRFWSSRYKHHFFTISEAEKDHIIAALSADWHYEGVAFNAWPFEP
ncbi:MAG: CARDB domain-containing protein [Kiritimatiellia bacterium]|jgi:hypothetical protein